MKRYIMELIGTFFLTLSVVLMGANGLAIGAMLLGLAYIGAHISGAHYNPSFTLSALLQRCLLPHHALWYWVMQVVGALLALVAIYTFVGVAYIHPIAPEISVWMLLGIELLLTFVFVMVFLALTKTSHLRGNEIYGIAIGFTLAAIAFFGGLYNSAIGLASLILDFGVKQKAPENLLWYTLIYIFAPLVAAILAVYIHNYLNECDRACSMMRPCGGHEMCKDGDCTHEECMHSRCSR